MRNVFVYPRVKIDRVRKFLGRQSLSACLILPFRCELPSFFLQLPNLVSLFLRIVFYQFHVIDYNDAVSGEVSSELVSKILFF